MWIHNYTGHNEHSTSSRDANEKRAPTENCDFNKVQIKVFCVFNYIIYIYYMPYKLYW